MRTRRITRGIASALLAICATPLAARAQKPMLQPTVPIRQLQGLRVPQINRDNTAQAVTVTIPNLYAIMSAVPGSPKASLTFRNVLFVSESANGKPPMIFGSGGSMWLAVGNAPAGYYHVRFDGVPTDGSTSATVQIHLGQVASDPLIATCTVTSSRSFCDTIISNPGGTFMLDGVITSGQFQFWDAYIAPTAPPLQP